MITDKERIAFHKEALQVAKLKLKKVVTRLDIEAVEINKEMVNGPAIHQALLNHGIPEHIIKTTTQQVSKNGVLVIFPGGMFGKTKAIKRHDPFSKPKASEKGEVFIERDKLIEKSQGDILDGKK